MRNVKNKWILIVCFCFCATFVFGNTNSKTSVFYPFFSIKKNIFVSEIEYDEIWEPTVFTHLEYGGWRDPISEIDIFLFLVILGILRRTMFPFSCLLLM